MRSKNKRAIPCVWRALYLSRIAEELELTSTASAEETRQFIEGKLLEMGKEPLNVQIELKLKEQGGFILLRDFDKVFLEVEPM